MTTVTLCGGNFATGAYVLHCHCQQPLSVTFGRFAFGRPVQLPAGDYLYVGSAMGRHATSLAARLLRHATRCPPRPPQPMRKELLAALLAAGLAATPPEAKRLRWHIDYLLDDPSVDLSHIWAIRSAESLEVALADWLASQDGLLEVARGLGAGDHPGATHLFRLAPAMSWSRLLEKLGSLWAGLPAD